jgi:hypothetical protein
MGLRRSALSCVAYSIRNDHRFVSRPLFHPLFEPRCFARSDAMRDFPPTHFICCPAGSNNESSLDLTVASVAAVLHLAVLFLAGQPRIATAPIGCVMATGATRAEISLPSLNDQWL